MTHLRLFTAASVALGLSACTDRVEMVSCLDATIKYNTAAWRFCDPTSREDSVPMRVYSQGGREWDRTVVYDSLRVLSRAPNPTPAAGVPLDG